MFSNFEGSFVSQRSTPVISNMNSAAAEIEILKEATIITIEAAAENVNDDSSSTLNFASSAYHTSTLNSSTTLDNFTVAGESHSPSGTDTSNHEKDNETFLGQNQVNIINQKDQFSEQVLNCGLCRIATAAATKS